MRSGAPEMSCHLLTFLLIGPEVLPSVPAASLLNSRPQRGLLQGSVAPGQRSALSARGRGSPSSLSLPEAPPPAQAGQALPGPPRLSAPRQICLMGTLMGWGAPYVCSHKPRSAALLHIQMPSPGVGKPGSHPSSKINRSQKEAGGTVNDIILGVLASVAATSPGEVEHHTSPQWGAGFRVDTQPHCLQAWAGETRGAHNYQVTLSKTRIIWGGVLLDCRLKGPILARWIRISRKGPANVHFSRFPTWMPKN